MRQKLEPLPGEWYRDVLEDRRIAVLTVDDKSDSIDIQYADGDVRELDRSGWNDLVLQMSSAPQNEYGADGEADDNGSYAKLGNEGDWSQDIDSLLDDEL